MKAEVEQVSQELDKMNGEILKLIDDESAKAGATRARRGRDAGATRAARTGPWRPRRTSPGGFALNPKPDPL